MQLISVNVGMPREVPWHDITISTGIYKKPVVGDVIVGKLNLDGDGQADLTVHGVPTKLPTRIPRSTTDFGAMSSPRCR
jgi:MOSC domain-containing protein YiiM